ncbi:nucleotidyltransferase family protein, partial [Serratia sp. 506_PEND]
MKQSIARLYFSRRLLKSYINTHDYIPENVENIDLQHININKLLPVLEWYIRYFSRTKELNSRNIEMICSYNRYQAGKQQKNEKYFHSVVAIKLKENGIPWTLRKGMSYTNYYKEKTHRTYNDIDLLILEKDKTVFQNTLTAIGFISGIYDNEKDIIKKHSREDALYYKMSPDHLPHYTKVLDDKTDICIDAAFTLAWDKFEEKEKLTKFIQSEKIQNKNGNSMTAGGHYLECAFHLYREMFSGSSKKSKTFRASGLLDLGLIRNHINYSYYNSLFPEVE